MGKSNNRLLDRLDIYLDKLISFSVLCWGIGFFSFVLRVKSKVGYWPFYANPEPQEIGFDLHYLVVFIGFFFLFLFSLSKFLSLKYEGLSLSKVLGVVVALGFTFLAISGEFGGALIVGTYFPFFIISLWLLVLLFIRKKFDLSTLTLQVSLILFWAHLIVDPFGLIEWFQD